jgi:hypothetical protein
MGKSTKARSKFDYDSNLFIPEPPEQAKLVESLFCGRTKELARGIEIMQRSLDVKGKRAKNQDKRPWVIHGESRSGKSHLARRIIIGLPKSLKRHQIIVSARERLDAMRVMTILFDDFHDEYLRRTNDQRLEQDLTQHPWVRLTDQLIERVAFFLGLGSIEAVTLKWSQEIKAGFEAGTQLAFVPKVIEFFAKFQATYTTGEALEVKLRPPTPSDLAEFCGIMVDTLLHLKLTDHVLVLVDDVDLLEGYADPVRNGRIQRSILSDALAHLNGTPGVDVLLTARSWYAHSKKDFQELVDLATAPPMSVKELVDIHNQRFAFYGGKGLPRQFLSAEALERAAEDVHGKPGVFLQRLGTAFRAYQDEDAWEERGYEWYFRVFYRIYTTYRDKCPRAAEALEKAVKEGQLTLDIGEKNPFHATIFDNEFVFQSYYQETNYFIDALTQQVIGQYVQGVGQG